MCDLDYYSSFDVDRFFRDYKDNQKKLKFLKAKHNSLLFGGSMDYETPKVSGGLPVSGVESKAERREKLEEDIKRLELYFSLCDRIVENMRGENEIIVREYFLKGRRSRADVDLLSYEIGCSPATFYRKVRQTRYVVKDYVQSICGGE